MRPKKKIRPKEQWNLWQNNREKQQLREKQREHKANWIASSACPNRAVLVCPDFPGILKESKISFSCTPFKNAHAWHRDSWPGPGRKTGKVSYWASKDLLASKAGWISFKDCVACLLWRRGLAFSKTTLHMCERGGPPFAGRRRLKCKVFPCPPTSLAPSKLSTPT